MLPQHAPARMEMAHTRLKPCRATDATSRQNSTYNGCAVGGATRQVLETLMRPRVPSAMLRDVQPTLFPFLERLQPHDVSAPFFASLARYRRLSLPLRWALCTV